VTDLLGEDQSGTGYEAVSEMLFVLAEASGALPVAVQIHKLTGPNLLAPKFHCKRLKIKQFGRLISVYPVQSVHAPLIDRFGFG
jgi:hypothetical protein